MNMFKLVQARRITIKPTTIAVLATVAVRVTVLAVATPAQPTSRLAGVVEPLMVVMTMSVAKTPFTVTARDPGDPTGTDASPAYTIENPRPDWRRVAEVAGAETAHGRKISPSRFKRLDADILESFIIYRRKIILAKVMCMLVRRVYLLLVSTPPRLPLIYMTVPVVRSMRVTS